MKYFLASCLFLFFGGMAIAQSHEGRLVYRETVSGTERQVTLYIAPKQVLIKRGGDKALYYLVHATDRNYSAWESGASRADKGQLKVIPNQTKMLPATSPEQIMSGFRAQEVRFELPDGSRFEGWFTSDIPFQHNAFVHRLLGYEWGWLPTDGVLLRWQYTDAKGRSLVAGELVSHQAGKQDPMLFVVPVTTDR